MSAGKNTFEQSILRSINEACSVLTVTKAQNLPVDGHH